MYLHFEKKMDLKTSFLRSMHFTIILIEDNFQKCLYMFYKFLMFFVKLIIGSIIFNNYINT